MSTLAQLIGNAFGAPAELPEFIAAPTPAAATRRRLKLWELPESRHCAVVGTCLPVIEMRKLAGRCGYEVREMSDYALHTVVVGMCGSRGDMADAVQRYFDKRYAAAIARFGRVREAAGVAALWREALAGGDDIAGALWAAWTHGALDDDTGKQIFGDIHMLSHQAGAAVRCDLQALDRHKNEAARLRNEVEALRRGMGDMQQAHDKTVAALRRELAAAEQRAAHYERRELELANAASNQRQYATLQQRAAALAERAEALEERNAENARRAAQLEIDLLESRAELAAAEDALALSLGVCDGVAGSSGCGKTCPAEQELAGRCVLCIGGRSGLVDGYRKVVEHRGGRFLHHDGGLEESLHRIDAAVAAADAVVCQTGCVSHAAYWRLKDACKKLDKPCVFVQSPGVGSFARGLTVLTGPSGGPSGGQHHGRLATTQ